MRCRPRESPNRTALNLLRRPLPALSLLHSPHSLYQPLNTSPMDSLPPAVRQALAELKLSSRASVEALIEAADGEEAKRGEEDTGRVADTSSELSHHLSWHWRCWAG